MSLVSIIIPVHNTAAYLKKCLDSLLCQTLEDIEIILAENMSTDGSYELCDELAKTDNRIRVLHLDKAGLSHARNRGVEAATSEYVGFVDSDDYVVRTMFEELYSAAKKYDADIVSCNFKIEENGRSFQTSQSDGAVSVFAPKEILKRIFEEKISSSACTKLFKRAFFGPFSFPEGRYFEDHALVYKIVSACSVCVYINKAMYVYIQRDGSICHSMTPIKRYHFFLADYERIPFIVSSDLFTDKEKEQMVRNQVDLCVAHFFQFLNLGGALTNKKEAAYMRQELIKCLEFGKDAVVGKTRDRILKLKYIYPIVTYIHNRIYKRLAKQDVASV